MKSTCRNRFFVSVFVAIFVFLLAACGGGGENPVETPPSTPLPYAFEEITLSPSGGEYDLGNGVNLSVPPGAVTQDTTISLRRVPAEEITGILNSYGQLDKTVLAGIQSSSEGITFLQPITISIPLETSLPPTALPFLMVVDTENQIYAFDGPAPSPSTVPSALMIPAAVDTDQPSAFKYVKYDCGNNRVIIADITKLPENERKLAAVAIEKLRAESDCFDDPCRCCEIRTTEESLDVARSGEGSPGECYNTVIKGSVQFLSCGDGTLTESYELVETSVHAVNLRPSALEMEPGSGAMVSVDVLDAIGNEIEFYTIADVPSKDPDVAEKGYIEIDQDLFQVLAKKPGETELNVILDCAITEPLPVTVNKIPIVTDQDRLVIPEGGNSTFQVRLGARPPEDTTILLSVDFAGGDSDISVIQGFLFHFNTSNWNIDQQVTVTAAEDQDVDNGSASITLSSASELLEDRTLDAREADNDIQQFVTSSGGISVPEGGTASFSVRLSNEPSGRIAVTVAHVFGDPDISVASGETLGFGVGDWNTPKAIVLNAAEDDEDIINGVATIRVSDDAGQLSTVDVAAKEVDNDLLQMVITPGELCIERDRTANLSVIGSTAIDLSQVQWESSDLNVALVDPTGIVTAQGDGASVISARVAGAEATAIVRVREHCFRIEPSNSCLHARVPGLPLLPTNLQQLNPRIDTAMAGHTVNYLSSNEAVVTIDATGTLTAHAGGDAVISASVDNVVTNYSYPDVISVHVAGGMDEYKNTPINLPIFESPPDASVPYDWLVKIDPYALFLTDERNIYTQDHVTLLTEEAGANCGGFPKAPSFYTITDFNNYGEYVGYYDHYIGRSAIYLDSTLCIFREMRIYPRETAKAINELGMTAIDIIDDDGDNRIALVTRNGSVSAPYAKTARGLNNNSLLLLDTNKRDTTVWDDQCTHYHLLIDSTMGADPNSLVDKIVGPGPCAHPKPMALNNYDIVVGNYLWGQYEDVGGPTAYYITYPVGIFLYYRDVFYDVPVGTKIWALDVNDSQDILGSSSSGAFVAHVCPFTLETNVCNWIPVDRRPEIEGYEAAEITCDGLDNDCDGLVDESLDAPLTFKQVGVCAGAAKSCRGRQGWIDDYSRIPDYEFPEVSCDGKDNDCDGILDEGCP